MLSVPVARGNAAKRAGRRRKAAAPRPTRKRAGDATTADRAARAGQVATVQCSIKSLRTSQYQPTGRPSSRALDAVTRAIKAAGSLAQLTSGESPVFESLDHESRDLAKLAADIAAHGVESPLDARETRDGIELLAGHRRFVAARLAGLTEVPVRVLGPLSEHEAAGFVLRRNRLRADFSTWHEAVLLRRLQQRRRDAGLGGDSVRALASAMAYSIGRVSELLAIGRAFPPPAVRAIGSGNEAVAEEALTGLSYRALRALIKETDSEQRVMLTRQALGLAPPSGDASEGSTFRQTPAFRSTARRGGGFTLSVHQPIDTLSKRDAERLLEVLTEHAESVRQRLRRA